MTAQFNLGDYGTKRKADDAALDSSSAKRSKRDVKKSKTTRERERIILENFVKYGILPSSPVPGGKTIPTRIPTPVSPLRTPTRPQSHMEDQRVPEIDAGDFECITSKVQTTCKFWRPWVVNPYKERKDCRKTPSGAQIRQKIAHNLHQSHPNRQTAVPKVSSPHQRPTHYGTSPRSFQGHYQQRQMSVMSRTPNASHLRNVAQQNLKNKRQSFTPTVKTWDTRSPEFLRSFKQPVKLMYPRSQAFDYKYKDAQQLLQAFPVQAAIGFYDDRDSSEDDSAAKMVAAQFRHLSAQRCTAVLN